MSQPAARSGPGLCSGRYRVVDLNVDDAGGTATLPLTDTSVCSFSFPGALGSSRMLVSSAGLGLLLRHRAGMTVYVGLESKPFLVVAIVQP